MRPCHPLVRNKDALAHAAVELDQNSFFLQRLSIAMAELRTNLLCSQNRGRVLAETLKLKGCWLKCCLSRPTATSEGNEAS